MFEVFWFQPSPARVVNDLTFNSVTRRLGGGDFILSLLIMCLTGQFLNQTSMESVEM